MKRVFILVRHPHFPAAPPRRGPGCHQRFAHLSPAATSAPADPPPPLPPRRMPTSVTKVCKPLFRPSSGQRRLSRQNHGHGTGHRGPARSPGPRRRQFRHPGQLKHLADAIQEVDKKRLEDKDAIAEEIRKSISGLEQSVASSPSPAPARSSRTKPAPDTPVSDKGYSYTIDR